jgi:cell division protein FtsQ
LVELIYIPLNSPRFAVRTVVVRGEDRVARVVASSIKLSPNTNFLRAPLRQTRKQVERVTAVRSAHVSRFFPNRMLVTFERREPISVIRRGDVATLVDPEGVTFTVPEEWGWGLPELAGPELSRKGPSGKAAEQEIKRLIAVLRALGPDPRLRVNRLQLDRDNRVEVVLESGATVKLGAPENLRAKAQLLMAAVEQVGLEQIHQMDLSDPKAAYWEPRAHAK